MWTVAGEYKFAENAIWNMFKRNAEMETVELPIGGKFSFPAFGVHRGSSGCRHAKPGIWDMFTVSCAEEEEGAMKRLLNTTCTPPPESNKLNVQALPKKRFSTPPPLHHR